MPTAHASIGASSIKRIIECPGSFTLLEALKLSGGVANRSSVYAAEGTAAHAVAEEILAGTEPAKLLGTTVKVDGHDIEVTEDMMDHVDVYVTAVQSLEALGADVSLEQQVSPFDLFIADVQKRLRDRGYSVFGTADCIGLDVGLKIVTILDFKYGRGVVVEAGGNAQARYYAAGALVPLIQAGLIDDPLAWRVRIGIVQPRAYHTDGAVRWDQTPDKQDLTVHDLLAWVNDTLQPAVQRVLDGDTTTKIGTWCQFCTVGSVPGACPSMNKLKDVAVASKLTEMSTKRAGEIGQYLNDLDALEDHIKQVREWAQSRLELDPRAVDGWKIVAKRATRRWTDEPNLARTLGDRLGDDVVADTLMTADLLSPAKMLPVLKKADPGLASEIETKFVTAQSSGTTLARGDDPRPAVASRPAAKDLFPDDLN